MVCQVTSTAIDRRGLTCSYNSRRLFLIYAIAVVVVILFYLFYFGRLLAWFISLILRTILWRRFKVWVDIGSVQFSPLGGRLLFRDVRYVGENQSIGIVMGSITWRYWLWRVRQDDDLRRGLLTQVGYEVGPLMLRCLYLMCRGFSIAVSYVDKAGRCRMVHIQSQCCFRHAVGPLKPSRSRCDKRKRWQEGGRYRRQSLGPDTSTFQ